MLVKEGSVSTLYAFLFFQVDPASFRFASSLGPDTEDDILLYWRVRAGHSYIIKVYPRLTIRVFRNKHFEALYLKGQIGLELVPQGTLAERLRAHASGMPAFFTPTGASTAVEEGSIPIRYKEGGMSAGVAEHGHSKETREINGRRYVLEPALAGDVAIIKVWKADEAGNCVFR